jgi:hypothetical protein
MQRPSYEEDLGDFDRNYAPDPTKLEMKAPPVLAKKENTKEEENTEAKKPLKTLLVFILSNFGILFVVIIYVFTGAFLFQILEQHTEIQKCQTGLGKWTNLQMTSRAQLFNYIYFNTTSDPWLPVDNSSTVSSLTTARDGPAVYNPLITSWLYNFTNEVRSIRSDHGYYGQDCESQSMWQYMSALLFTFTIVSTIGKLSIFMLIKTNLEIELKNSIIKNYKHIFF